MIFFDIDAFNAHAESKASYAMTVDGDHSRKTRAYCIARLIENVLESDSEYGDLVVNTVSKGTVYWNTYYFTACFIALNDNFFKLKKDFSCIDC